MPVAAYSAARDTTINGVNYNTVERNNGGTGTVVRVCNMQEFDGTKKLHGPAILFHAYPYGAISARGSYYMGAESQVWTYYYPNGMKSSEGKYTAIGQRYEIREVQGTVVRYGYEPLKEFGWKYWDEFGNRIDEAEFNTINNKRNLRATIEQHEKNVKVNSADTAYMNRIIYYKKVFTRKYPAEVFWKDSVGLTDGPIVYPTSSRLIAIDYYYGDTNTVVVTGGFILTFHSWKSEWHERGDTILIGGSGDVTGKVFSIASACLDSVSVEQCFETSVTVSGGNGHHTDLRNFRHGYTEWKNLEPNDSAYRFILLAENEEMKLPFPAVTAEELSSALKAQSNWMSADIIRSITLPYSKPCSVVPSAVLLRIAGVDKISGRRVIRYVKVELSIGC